MNHRKGFSKLGLRTSYRKALLKNLMSALLDKEKIVTTLSKAKETQRLVEKLITKAKNVNYEKYIKNYEEFVKLRKDMILAKKENKHIDLTQEKQDMLDLAAKVTHTYRMIQRQISDKNLQKKLISDIGFRVKKRNGGYTRIYHIGQRKGDAAEMALIELVDKPKENKKEDKKNNKEAVNS